MKKEKCICVFLGVVLFLLIISFEVHGDTHRMKSEVVVSFYEKDYSEDNGTSQAEVLPQTNYQDSDWKWSGIIILIFVYIYFENKNEYEKNTIQKRRK